MLHHRIEGKRGAKRTLWHNNLVTSLEPEFENTRLDLMVVGVWWALNSNRESRGEKIAVQPLAPTPLDVVEQSPVVESTASIHVEWGPHTSHGRLSISDDSWIGESNV